MNYITKDQLDIAENSASYMARFLKKQCELGSEYRIAKTEFYENYCNFIVLLGGTPPGINDVGRLMKSEFKVGEGRTKTTRFWKGIRLRSAQTESEVSNEPIFTPSETDSSTLENDKTVGLEPSSSTACNSSTRSNHEEILNEKLRRDLIGNWVSRRL